MGQKIVTRCFLKMWWMEKSTVQLQTVFAILKTRADALLQALGVMGLGVVEVEVRGRKRLDVIVSKGVWNCGEEWVNKTFRVPSTE